MNVARVCHPTVKQVQLLRALKLSSPSSALFVTVRGHRMSCFKEALCQDDVSIEKKPEQKQSEYPTKGRRAVILLCLILGTFLVAIDTTIISVAIPNISTDFKALDDVGWYGSAYLLTLTAFQPTMGKVYKMFSPKTAYLASMAVFEGTNQVQSGHCCYLGGFPGPCEAIIPPLKSHSVQFRLPTFNFHLFCKLK